MNNKLWQYQDARYECKNLKNPWSWVHHNLVCAPPLSEPEGLSPHSQGPAINSLLKQINLVHILSSNFFIIIIIGSTALGGPWLPQANVASDLYPRQPPASFYHPFSLRLPVPRPMYVLSRILFCIGSCRCRDTCPASFPWGFVTTFFYGVRFLASRPTPNLED